MYFAKWEKLREIWYDSCFNYVTVLPSDEHVEPEKRALHKEKKQNLCMYTIYAVKCVDFLEKSDRIKFYTGFISKHA